MRLASSKGTSRTGLPKWLLAGIAAAGTLLAMPETARADAPDGFNEPYEYNYKFPLWGKKLASRGLKFPLPFGIGLNYLSINQDVNIDGVEIAVNDSEYVNLDEIVKFEKVRSSVQGIGARFDLWVFPFLNVYGLASYAANVDTEVVLAQPFKLRAGAAQSGYGGGFGVTGAFGVFGFFVTMDANWTWQNMEKLDTLVRTFLLTPRIGKKFYLSPSVSIAPWVGAMRQEIAAETSGSILLSETIGEPSDSFKAKVGEWYGNLSPGQQAVVGAVAGRLQEREDPVIHYRLDKALADPWNMLLGFEVDLHQRVQMRMEYGFLGRSQLLLGINYRFGLIPD